MSSENFRLCFFLREHNTSPHIIILSHFFLFLLLFTITNFTHLLQKSTYYIVYKKINIFILNICPFLYIVCWPAGIICVSSTHDHVLKFYRSLFTFLFFLSQTPNTFNFALQLFYQEWVLLNLSYYYHLRKLKFKTQCHLTSV